MFSPKGQFIKPNRNKSNAFAHLDNSKKTYASFLAGVSEENNLAGIRKSARVMAPCAGILQNIEYKAMRRAIMHPIRETEHSYRNGSSPKNIEQPLPKNITKCDPFKESNGFKDRYASVKHSRKRNITLNEGYIRLFGTITNKNEEDKIMEYNRPRGRRTYDEEAIYSRRFASTPKGSIGLSLKRKESPTTEF